MIGKAITLAAFFAGLTTVFLVNEIGIDLYPPSWSAPDGRWGYHDPAGVRFCMGARALAARGPVVADPDDDAVLRQHLLVKVFRVSPAVHHGLAVRPAVHVLIDRILLGRIEVRRLDDHRLHFEAIAGGDCEEFRRGQAEIT